MLSKLRLVMEMIKFEHSVFALPFAYIAAFMAEGKVPAAASLLWITLAMVSGRTTAMTLNRIIDRFIDAANPRTKSRALPLGLIRVNEVWVYTALSAAVFFLASYQLSRLAFVLSPLALLAFMVYPYTKRFTWLSHYCLGMTIGLAPLGAWIAITDSIPWEALSLSLGVALWVAGFDIIYACDDFEFDRATGLYSIPARFGISLALRISALTHMASAALLLITGWLLQLGIAYWLGFLAAILLMRKQHLIIQPDNLSRTNIAFFNLNGGLSIVMFIATYIEIAIR